MANRVVTPLQSDDDGRFPGFPLLSTGNPCLEAEEMMSVHDALEAWQAGQITARRAMRLTGATDVMELYAYAHECDVEVRTHLLPREEEQAEHATALIRQAILRTDAENEVAAQGMAAK